MMSDNFNDISDESIREMLLGFVDQIRSGKPANVIGMVMKSRLPNQTKLHERVFKAAGSSVPASNSNNNSNSNTDTNSSQPIDKKKKKKKTQQETTDNNANSNNNHSISPTQVVSPNSNTSNTSDTSNSNNNTNPSPNISSNESTAVVVVKKKKSKKKDKDTESKDNTPAEEPRLSQHQLNLKSRSSVTDVTTLLAEDPKKTRKKQTSIVSNNTNAVDNKQPIAHKPPTERTSTLDLLEATPSEIKKINKQTEKILAEEQRRLQKEALANNKNKSTDPNELMFGNTNDPIERDRKKDAAWCIIS